MRINRITEEDGIARWSGDELEGTVAGSTPGIWKLSFRRPGPLPPERDEVDTGIVAPPPKSSVCVSGPENHDWRLTTAAGDGDDLVIYGSHGGWSWGPLSGRFEVSEAPLSLDPQVGEKQAHRLPESGLRFALIESAQRRYFGLGARTGFLDKKGRIWENWTTDCGHLEGTIDPLYQAHPFLMIRDGSDWRGVYLDDPRRSVFDLARSHPAWSRIHVEADAVDLYLIPGPTPADVIERLTTLTGRPPMPPLWAFGYHQCRWTYNDAKDVREVADGFESRGIPLTSMWLDIDYMDDYKVFTFGADKVPEPKQMIGSLQERGIRTVCIVDPGVKKEAGYEVYEEGHRRDAFIKDSSGEEFEGEVWPSPAVWPDFTREDVRTWWGKLHRFYKNLGVAGIWNDMNEPANLERLDRTLPTDARHAHGPHSVWHNLYGLHMAIATRNGLEELAPERRPFLLTRSGFTGIQKYAWVWTGDNTSSYTQLESSVPMLLNLSLSGVPFCGSDIGGFFFDCDGPLLARWSWLGVFYPFMRNHAAKGTARQEPWVFGDEVCEAVKEAVEFRYQLLPYLYSVAREAHKTGLPMMRPLFFLDHSDEAASVHDQFLCGADLMVAPISRPDTEHRAVYIPEGQWQDFWTGTVYEGPTWIVAQASLRGIPLYQRKGSAVPLATGKPQTETARWPELTWRIVPGAKATSQCYLDEGDGYAPGDLLNLETELTAQRELVMKCKGKAPATHRVEWLGANAPRKDGQPAGVAFDAPRKRLSFDLPRQSAEVRIPVEHHSKDC